MNIVRMLYYPLLCSGHLREQVHRAFLHTNRARQIHYLLGTYAMKNAGKFQRDFQWLSPACSHLPPSPLPHRHAGQDHRPWTQGQMKKTKLANTWEWTTAQAHQSSCMERWSKKSKTSPTLAPRWPVMEMQSPRSMWGSSRQGTLASVMRGERR